MLPTKFQVNKPFSLGEEAKNRFLRWPPGGHFGFLIRTILSIFDLQVPPCFLPSFESIGLSVQEKKRKIDFQDGRHGGHLGFLVRTILAIFDLQVTPMLPTKFRVTIGLSVQEKKRKLYLRPSGISEQNDFSYF